MVNRIIKYLIYNKLIAFLLLLLFLAWGLINAPFRWDLDPLPSYPVAVDAIPDLGENQQIVFTEWPGRSPQDVEDQITYPLSSALQGLAGVRTIRSTSMFGFSSIYLIFEEGIDFYWSRSRVLEKLNSLADGLLPPGVAPTLGPDATALGQIYWYTLEGRDNEGKPTGGWDLQELRSIQDFYVKYALTSSSGVSEVASIGGYVKEYQVDVNPELLKQYGIKLQQVMMAVKNANREVGARTLEMNKVEYLIRGLGYIKSLHDLEEAVVDSKNDTPIRIKDVARVYLGPAERRGILDKEGAEVVGGVVVARYGANPLEVIEAVKEKINEIEGGLPSKTLADGRISQVKIIPFYDRTTLIEETLDTLNEALLFEVLITILVVVLLVVNLRASLLISGLLPLAILMVFIAMKFFKVDANIVALSGIAIAIGTMVDMGIILTENILGHLEKNNEKSIEEVVYEASSEVSGAIVTAVMTTILSFLPVFTLTAAEGKLFRPLAFTKTFALLAALLITLFLIPPLAALLFKKVRHWKGNKWVKPILYFIIGSVLVFYKFPLGWALFAFGVLEIWKSELIRLPWPYQKNVFQWISFSLVIGTILIILSAYWYPLGIGVAFWKNFLFIVLILGFFMTIFFVFQHYYERLLRTVLNNKMIFLTVPIGLIISGFFIMQNTGKEFMPSLNEGSFLLMPTSMPHAGIEENKRVLQLLDKAVAHIPEVENVVGKAGRVNSALDPAPLSMYENIITYKPEYKLDLNGKRQRFKTDEDGLFLLKSGKAISAGVNISADSLIPDDNGIFFRNWRPQVKTTDDIWDEIVLRTRLLGVTSAPKLQPIETRLIMLQTGMRAPMGIKVKGPSLETIQDFGFQLEKYLRQVEGVKKEAVFADRIIGKPYLLIDIKRNELGRYGLSIEDVLQVIEMAVGGMPVSQTVEGRERYGIRVRYPRELRNSPEKLGEIYVNTPKGQAIPLNQVVSIKYEQGPQMIKSEDAFLTGYVLFDKMDGYAEVNVVEAAQAFLDEKIEKGELLVPQGISYRFTGTYENQLHAQKTLSMVIPLVLLLIFLILYFQFRSVSLSLFIFSGIAVAFSGGFLLIALYGQDWFLNIEFLGVNVREIFQIRTINLSVAVWVGFIALFGIATDDGVVMGTYLVQSFEKEKPNSIAEIREAVVIAGKKRIRPCLMTSATTILALLPVLTSSGRGSDIMIPMAIPAFGGMLLVLITLFVVPVLYSWKQEYAVSKYKRL